MREAQNYRDEDKSTAMHKYLEDLIQDSGLRPTPLGVEATKMAQITWTEDGMIAQRFMA